jgi:phenylalanine-4-hydroxylase
MYGMNRILTEIGCCGCGWIYSAQRFMEFQAYMCWLLHQIFVNLNILEYTPAPDIIHEGAGHIIANPEYAEYLRRFGEIGCKAISSDTDYQMYEAIRCFDSERSRRHHKQLLTKRKAVEDLQNNMGELSEMAQIRNLHWWTVEYGLIGTLDNPKIYAGLLFHWRKCMVYDG